MDCKGTHFFGYSIYSPIFFSRFFSILQGFRFFLLIGFLKPYCFAYKQSSNAGKINPLPRPCATAAAEQTRGPGTTFGNDAADTLSPYGRGDCPLRPQGSRMPIRQPEGDRRKTARKPRPEAGRNPRTTAGRSGASGWGQTKKRRSRPPKETAPNMFDMRYSVNAFRIPTRRRPQASTRVSPDRPDSRPSAQRSSRRPLRRQAPAACAPRR